MDNNLLIILIWIILSLAILIISLIIRFKKQLNQKDIQIKESIRETEDLDNRYKEKERRKSFRLEVDEQCNFQILKIGDKKIDLVKGRKGLGIINDVSFTGLRLESEYDLPVKDVVEVLLEFKFVNQEFELKGKLIRKEEQTNTKNYMYGIKFIETDVKMQNEFNKLLQNKELEKGRILIG